MNPHTSQKNLRWFRIWSDELYRIESERDEAIEQNAAMRETLARLREWHGLTDAEMRLRCGEMNAQEIRNIRAVLNAILKV